MDKQNLTSTLGQWLGEFDALAFTALRIAAIIFVSWLVLMIVGRLIRGVRTRVAARVNDPEFNKRAETLARVARYLSSVIVGLFTVMLVLSELGVSAAPIQGAAGVVGLEPPVDVGGPAGVEGLVGTLDHIDEGTHLPGLLMPINCPIRLGFSNFWAASSGSMKRLA